MIRILQNIQEYGLMAIIPHTKKLTGTPFWEIRVLGKHNIRVVYISLVKDRILLIHGFVKKKQKTPAKDLKIISIIYKDWLAN